MTSTVFQQQALPFFRLACTNCDFFSCHPLLFSSTSFSFLHFCQWQWYPSPPHHPSLPTLCRQGGLLLQEELYYTWLSTSHGWPGLSFGERVSWITGLLSIPPSLWRVQWRQCIQSIQSPKRKRLHNSQQPINDCIFFEANTHSSQPAHKEEPAHIQPASCPVAFFFSPHIYGLGLCLVLWWQEMHEAWVLVSTISRFFLIH